MSKGTAALRTPQQIKDQVPPDEVDDLFRRVIAQRIPIGEHIDFIFVLEGVSVSWREQGVRHRIGVKISPERLGIDLIPDLADSTFWSQSMRIMDMGEFASRGEYRVPETLDGKVIPQGFEGMSGASAEEAYRTLMWEIQQGYNALVAAGVPMEDARELIPLGAQHRLSWKLNIGALQHILGKRGCWILQGGLWGPVARGMMKELAEKVDPVFRDLATPPCVKGNQFTGCVFREEARRRLTGEDELPPCPLHLAQHVIKDPDLVRLRVAKGEFLIPHPDSGEVVPLLQRREMLDRLPEYAQLWNRDPYTGEHLG